MDVPPHHFRNPYPTPTWNFRPSHLSGLALTLPDFLPRTPEPSPEPSDAPSHTRREHEDVKPEPSSSSCKCHVSLLFRDCVTDNTTAKVTSSASHGVKTEPSSQTNSSITPGEPCKEYFSNNCRSELKALAAYRPAQALRDQIAMLNTQRASSQGACTLCCLMY